jgi:hypothetical protein
MRCDQNSEVTNSPLGAGGLTIGILGLGEERSSSSQRPQRNRSVSCVKLFLFPCVLWFKNR